jgi:hypothetical protein
LWEILNEKERAAFVGVMNGPSGAKVLELLAEHDVGEPELVPWWESNDVIPHELALSSSETFSRRDIPLPQLLGRSSQDPGSVSFELNLFSIWYVRSLSMLSGT